MPQRRPSRRLNDRDIEIASALATLAAQQTVFQSTFIELKSEIHSLRIEITRLHEKIERVEKQVAKHAVIFGALGSIFTIMISAVIKYLPQWAN